MHIVLTNRGRVAVPFSSSQGNGIAIALEPDEPYAFDNAEVTVANVGDNPSFAEEVTSSFKKLIEKLGDLLLYWRDHSKSADELGAVVVQVTIENKGTNALRVLLGNNLSEVTVQPGGTHEAAADEYVEIRELGV